MFQILVNEKITQQEKIENNKKEWHRINNIWLEIKNNNKINHPELYDTDSDKSDENNITENTNTNSKILKRCGSSYDELLSSQDCIINEKNEIKCNTPIIYDAVEDSKTHFTSSTSCSSSSPSSPPHTSPYSYSIADFDIYTEHYQIYNMKTLTHIGNYYNIMKKEKKKKMLKQELIYSIVLFETDKKNYPIVYKCREMLQKIEDLKNDKYFSSFVLFP